MLETFHCMHEGKKVQRARLNQINFLSFFFAKQFSSTYCLVCLLLPHPCTRRANLCSEPAGTAVRHWPWPGSATVPSTSSIPVWSAIQRNTHSIRCADNCFKVSLWLCRLIWWRIKRNCAYVKKKKKKRLRSRATTLNHLTNCGRTNAVCHVNEEKNTPQKKIITHTVLESNQLNFWSCSIDYQPPAPNSQIALMWP